MNRVQAKRPGPSLHRSQGNKEAFTPSVALPKRSAAKRTTGTDRATWIDGATGPRGPAGPGATSFRAFYADASDTSTNVLYSGDGLTLKAECPVPASGARTAELKADFPAGVDIGIGYTRRGTVRGSPGRFHDLPRPRRAARTPKRGSCEGSSRPSSASMSRGRSKTSAYVYRRKSSPRAYASRSRRRSCSQACLER